jgi:hypothetical protein
LIDSKFQSIAPGQAADPNAPKNRSSSVRGMQAHCDATNAVQSGGIPSGHTRAVDGRGGEAAQPANPIASKQAKTNDRAFFSWY